MSEKSENYQPSHDAQTIAERWRCTAAGAEYRVLLQLADWAHGAGVYALSINPKTEDFEFFMRLSREFADMATRTLEREAI